MNPMLGRSACTGVLLWLGLAAGCATLPTAVVTDPPGAFVSVNGSGLGAAPVNFTFDFGKQPAYQVTATRTGFFDASATVTRDTPNLASGTFQLNLQRNQAYEETATTDATNRWLRIEVGAAVKQDEAWQKIVDTVTGRYTILEQMDASSGYLRSVTISRSFKHPQLGDFTIRTQFVGAIASRTPLVYKIRIQSEQSSGSGSWTPYDRVFKEDAQLVEELQNRIGLK